MIWEQPFFMGLLIAWSAVTVVYVCLAAYRSIIGLKEDDQIFLDPAEEGFRKEQEELQIKMNKMRPYTKTFGYASSGLLVVMLGLLVVEGMQRLM